MTYSINNLIMDVIPRIGKLADPTGITIWQAANSVKSLIYKRLLERRSDILASGDLSLTVPALGYSADLPSDFVSMAEKPCAVDLLTDWMAGTVTSYNSTTGALVMNATVAEGSSELSSWNISMGALPGQSASSIGTSVSTETVGTGSRSFTTQAGLDLEAGDYIIVSSGALPSDWESRYQRLNPYYLDDDDHIDFSWWEWYGLYGDSLEPPSVRPQKFKIIGTTMYVRPKVIVNVMITGKYNAKPTDFTAGTDTVPWNSLFDEVFRDGVVRILAKGISSPETDADFMAFVLREVDTVLNSRIILMPDTRRLKRSNWL